MKYIATDKCPEHGKMKPFAKADRGVAVCHQCLKHTCKVPVRVEK